MTEQETVLLIETEQRCKSNTHRIDNLEGELKEIQSEQKAIYKIATSVELIAQRVSNIEGKVDDTNRKVDAQAKHGRRPNVNCLRRLMKPRTNRISKSPTMSILSKLQSLLASLPCLYLASLAQSSHLENNI